MVPPTVDQYEFFPPPPLDMVPPIAADHMVHLLLAECTPIMQVRSFYLEQLPKKKDKPLKFDTTIQVGHTDNTGYGLRFVEKSDPSVIVTFLFALAVLVGLTFGIFWSIFKQDLQNAWTIAAYVVSTMTLAAMTWQARATS
jgi:hypothetical protein